MYILLAKNPSHPMDEMVLGPVVSDSVISEPVAAVKVKKERVYGKYFTPLTKIITAENVTDIPASEVHGKFVGKQEGAKRVGHYVFATDAENFIAEDKNTIPSRLIAKLHNVRRIWTLDSVDSKLNIVYKSMLGDKLILTNA